MLAFRLLSWFVAPASTINVFHDLGITYGITTYNRIVIGPYVLFHIKRYLTDDIHFDSQRLPRVSTMVKLRGVNWVKKQK